MRIFRNEIECEFSTMKLNAKLNWSNWPENFDEKRVRSLPLWMHIAQLFVDTGVCVWNESSTYSEKVKGPLFWLDDAVFKLANIARLVKCDASVLTHIMDGETGVAEA